MNLLIIKPKSKEIVTTNDLINYLKNSKVKTATVSMSNDLKCLQIELKVTQ